MFTNSDKMAIYKLKKNIKTKKNISCIKYRNSLKVDAIAMYNTKFIKIFRVGIEYRFNQYLKL